MKIGTVFSIGLAGFFVGHMTLAMTQAHAQASADPAKSAEAQTQPEVVEPGVAAVGLRGSSSEIAVAPTSFSFSVEPEGADSGTLEISNVGSGDLDWDIELEPAQVSPRSHDPALDEVLTIPDFAIVSPASGGEPHIVTVAGGLDSGGQVVGFSFEGTVSGITHSLIWASDMCMQIEGPDGSSYSVGGIVATIPNCNVNNWDFQGENSTDDGTYSSEHDDVWPFPPGADDEGDWTFTFTFGWNTASGIPMDWSDVTVTLHKLGLPEPCDLPAAVSWLSVSPASGSTAGGATDSVDVTVDADGLAEGTYSASLCVNSNDEAGNELVVVPVELIVATDPVFEDRFEEP